jgi:hypothetical protein
VDDEHSESQKASSEADIPGPRTDEKDEENPEESEGLGKITKKDFSTRRIELLTKSGLAQVRCYLVIWYYWIISANYSF